VVITEVRIKLMEDHNENERLQAFCSVTFDDAFIVRGLKIIEGTKGPFVAMPRRKLTDRCRQCGCKNHLRARFCNQCGHKLDENRATRDADGRAKLHADIARPIDSACREVIQTAVLTVFRHEKERAKQARPPEPRDRVRDRAKETVSEPHAAQEPHPLRSPEETVERPFAKLPDTPRQRLEAVAALYAEELFATLPDAPRRRLEAVPALYSVIRQQAAKELQRAVAAIGQQAAAAEYDEMTELSRVANDAMRTAQLGIRDPETGFPASLKPLRPRPSSCSLTRIMHAQSQRKDENEHKTTGR
jgi:stage V sporulation protein G